MDVCTKVLGILNEAHSRSANELKFVAFWPGIGSFTTGDLLLARQVRKECIDILEELYDEIEMSKDTRKWKLEYFSTKYIQPPYTSSFLRNKLVLDFFNFLWHGKLTYLSPESPAYTYNLFDYYPLKHDIMRTMAHPKRMLTSHNLNHLTQIISYSPGYIDICIFLDPELADANARTKYAKERGLSTCSGKVHFAIQRDLCAEGDQCYVSLGAGDGHVVYCVFYNLIST